MLGINKVLARIMLGTCLIAPTLTFAADAGYIVSTEGDVKIARGVTELPATSNTKLQVADEIRTGSPGKTYWGMADGSRFAVRKNSNFRIDNFQKKSSESDAMAVYSLLKGAFRTVSGWVGKSSSDTYRVNTPVATMGIRGTDYAGLMKADGGKDGHPDGLYFHVYEGSIFITTNAGTVEFKAGQSGYVSNIDSLPTLIDPQVANEIFEQYSDDSIFAIDAFRKAGFDPLGAPDFDLQRIEFPRIEQPASPS